MDRHTTLFVIYKSSKVLMLFACVSRPELIENLERVDGLELRLDLFPWSKEKIKETIKKYVCILTLRRTSSDESDEEGREKKIRELLQLEPSFFDLESDMREEFLKEVIQNYPRTKIILSYHNYRETPEDLDSIYQSMSRFGAFGYKMATMTNSTNDALKMLLFSKKHPKLSTICMGERGAFARVLGAVFGNPIDYGAVHPDETVAPGQLTIGEMGSIYRYWKINGETALYGLIGDPVVKSQGHLYHNGVFQDRKINAVYVKMRVTPDELSTFIQLAKELQFQGLSVTMPLKERILPFIDEGDVNVHSCKASNTLSFKGGTTHGTNTDGSGALDAIENRTSVSGKKLVILGAGGAARAIAFEAKKRGADVQIVNRTHQKGEKLATELGVSFGKEPGTYDILVSCTPITIEIEDRWIAKEKLVMDITYAPKKTPILRKALLKGCEVIYGEEMFFNQAKQQTTYWFS